MVICCRLETAPDFVSDTSCTRNILITLLGPLVVSVTLAFLLTCLDTTLLAARASVSGLFVPHARRLVGHSLGIHFDMYVRW